MDINPAIRFGKIEDLPAIVDIYNHAIRSGGCTGDLDEFTVQDRINWFEKFNSNNSPIYVITVGNDIAGYGTLSPYRQGRKAMRNIAEISFFLDEKLQLNESTPFKITSGRMIRKMSLSQEERDMVLLQHIFFAAYPDGTQEVIKSSMIDFGSPSTNTSVARTVSLPAAIAVKLILEKKINLTGVYRPVVPQIYNPVLDELKSLNIEMKEEFGLPESEMIQ